MTALVPIAAVLIVLMICLATEHAFQSWLKQRERERLSKTDKAELDAKFAEQAEWKNKVNQFMANARPR